MVHPRGEVVLIRVPFHQSGGSKVRPAVVVLDSGDDDFVAVPVTSQPRQSAYDLTLADWQNCGLNVASTARIHKIAVLSKSDIARQVGQLSAADAKRLAELICRVYCPQPQ